ncbi:MAG: hypothetical protein J6Z08_03580 [Elusimicrobiales bacterium]|nr:hypothetical protein [Elusimicrobiales bacterium]
MKAEILGNGNLPYASITLLQLHREYISPKVNSVLGGVAYFCELYPSWEKGSIENRNGIIRQCLTKKADFKKIRSKMLARIQENKNFTLMKCLGGLNAIDAQFKAMLSLYQIKRKVFSPKKISSHEPLHFIV